MIDDLISRLRARRRDRSVLVSYKGEWPERLINPDGPKAAEALILLRDALNDVGTLLMRARESGVFNVDTGLAERTIDAALTPTKIEKAEQ